MQKSTIDYDVTTDGIPDGWMEKLEKNGLASIACKGPSLNIISNLLQYSRQLVVLGSVTKMLVNLN